ncbi:MAG: tetratricopeptide repeat protein [Candidatus Marinimicrobia bacterium]|nr:tetratricopeptide repeat protein [Candidatus Neomarinimicrobiota bacterium]
MLTRDKLTTTLLVWLLLAGSALGANRLAFSRPGEMMRVPMNSMLRSPFLFSAGFVTEVVTISPYNSAQGVYFDSEISKNFRLGLTSVTGADTSRILETSTYDPPLEIGFHLQQRLWTYGNISFALGVHDIVLTQESGKFKIDPDLVSYLGVISSEQTIGNYNLGTYMGFGTGIMAGATSAATSDTNGSYSLGGSSSDTSSLSLGVFAGFRLMTPIFANRGGLGLIGEFDGAGINLGVSVPLTRDYRFHIGLVHAENLPNFGTQSENLPLETNAPSLVVGLNLSVPRAVAAPAGREIDGLGPRITGAEEGIGLPTVLLDSTLQQADYLLASLRDSLRIARFEIDNLHSQLAQKDQQSIVFSDSLRNTMLRIEMMKSNLNYTMQHLSASWQYFADENYRDALQEVEMAIQLSPDIAIAYARRGSIYYKLGDIQRATINWNLALKLDPEYDDVRNILRALKENRLKTTSLNQQ